MIESRVLSTTTVTAVISPSSATGRGEVPVNWAWVLAVNEYRVLIVDLDGRGLPASASLAHYRAAEPARRPFHAPLWLSSWLPTPAPVEGYNLTSHALPDGRSWIDVLDLSELHQNGEESVAWTDPARMKAGLTTSGYDHVLLVVPAQLVRLAAPLSSVSDRVVLACELAPDQVRWADQCRGILQQFWQVTEPALVLQDVLGFTGAERDTLLSAARSLFGDTTDANRAKAETEPLSRTGTGRRQAPLVLIPPTPAPLRRLGLIVPFEAPTIIDLDNTDLENTDPGRSPADPPRPITQAYLALGRLLCNRPLSTPPVLPPGTRRRYEQAAGRRPVSSPAEVTVVHQAHHGRMAAWIQQGLAAEGCEVHRVTSPADLQVASGTTIVTLPDADAPPRPDVDRISLRLGPAPHDLELTLASDPGPDSPAEVIDLSDADATTAWSFLCRRLGFEESQAAIRRLPPLGEPSPAGSPLPLRNSAFTGRDATLEALHDTLGSGAGTQQLWIAGPPGIGKSEFAREYLHRFGADYEWVCWLPAESAASIHTGMHLLARDRGIDPSGAVIPLLLAHLATCEASWLLVLDGVTNPADLNGLVPDDGRGHVLVTARDIPPGTKPPRSLLLPPFETPEATALLRTLTRLHDQPELAQLAARAGTHPLSVHLAGSWVAETARQMLRTGRTTHLDATRWAAREFALRQTSPDCGDPEPRRSEDHDVMHLVLELLGNVQTGAPLVRQLALALTALNPSGTDVALLSTAGMIQNLAAAAGVDGAVLLDDSNELHLTLQTGVRCGLLDLSWPTGVRLRGLEETEATLARRVGEAALAASRQHVLDGLAAACPTDAEGDDATTLPRYTELGRHLVASGAKTSDRPTVRRWVLRQIQHWYHTGDVKIHRWTLDLAEEIFADWSTRFRPHDPLRLRLGTQIANLHRDLGDDTRALAMDDLVLAGQRRTLGVNHPRAWMTARGRVSDLLGLGRFAEALFEGQHAYKGFRDAYGEDHRETLMTAHNLSLCLAVNGQDREAAEREFDTLLRLARVIGRHDPTMINSVVQLSYALRNLGLINQAHRQIARVRDWTQANPGVSSRAHLRLRHADLVLARDSGNVTLALDQHGDALHRYETLLGLDHPEVVACRLSVAGHRHRAGDSAGAVRLARSCLESLIASRGPDHPFAGVCHDQLGVFLRGAGQAQPAREHAHQAVDDLTSALGDVHPWTLAARINATNLVADRGIAQAAADADHGIYCECRQFLAQRHPLISAAERNLRSPDAGREPATTARTSVLTEIPFL